MQGESVLFNVNTTWATGKDIKSETSAAMIHQHWLFLSPARLPSKQDISNMVKLALPLVVLATAVSAVPAATVPAAVAPPATSRTTFSFAQWVEDLAANPDTALTPDEAIAAAQAADAIGSAGGLKQRFVSKPWCTPGSGAVRPGANVCLASCFIALLYSRSEVYANRLVYIGTGCCCLS